MQDLINKETEKKKKSFLNKYYQMTKVQKNVLIDREVEEGCL